MNKPQQIADKAFTDLCSIRKQEVEALSPSEKQRVVTALEGISRLSANMLGSLGREDQIFIPPNRNREW